MKPSEAKMAVAIMSAAWPREPMPDSTVQVWSAALEEFEFPDVSIAVRDLVLLLDRMPSLHQIVVATDRARIDRIASIPALPEDEADGVGFGDWVKTLPEEEQKRVRYVFEGLRRKLHTEMEDT